MALPKFGGCSSLSPLVHTPMVYCKRCTRLLALLCCNVSQVEAVVVVAAEDVAGQGAEPVDLVVRHRAGRG